MTHRSPVFCVELRPSGRQFDAAPSTTILLAAAQAGIELPSSCRNGTCRTCMCRRISGDIVYGIEWPGLSAEEKAEGWILPCVARASSALVLETPGARPLKVEVPRPFAVGPR
jgi:ferredoxin